MMKQMVVTYDTEVLHTIESFSNADNQELLSCAPPPFSEILDPPVICTNIDGVFDMSNCVENAWI